MRTGQPRMPALNCRRKCSKLVGPVLGLFVCVAVLGYSVAFARITPERDPTELQVESPPRASAPAPQEFEIVRQPIQTYDYCFSLGRKCEARPVDYTWIGSDFGVMGPVSRFIEWDPAGYVRIDVRYD